MSKIVKIKEAAGPPRILNKLHKDRHDIKGIITMYYDKEGRVHFWMGAQEGSSHASTLWLLELGYEAVKKELLYTNEELNE